ncbi:MAG: hypothetical protein M0Z33_08005 [Actinomycetota bacterium]|nr:hypothetical protein [Actinomycetota bacterium]
MIGAASCAYGLSSTTAGHVYAIAGTGDGAGGTGGIAGGGGPGASAELNSPDGVATDASGDVLIADLANNRVQRITGNFTDKTTYTYDAARNLTTGPGGTTQAFDAAGELCWATPVCQAPVRHLR